MPILLITIIFTIIYCTIYLPYFYKIKDKLSIGEISNMYAIIELMNSSRTIKL